MAQSHQIQQDPQQPASDFYNWFNSKFGSQVSKHIDGPPGNSGSVVDISIGNSKSKINFSPQTSMM